MPDEDPNLVTAARAAFLVGVPERQVHRWKERGEIWALGQEPGSNAKLYSLRRCKELAAGYHARKAARSKTKH